VEVEFAEQGHILLPARVGDVEVTALLDTGSGHSGVNTRVTDAMDLDLPEPPPGSHGVGIETGPVRVGSGLLRERATLLVMDRADIFSAFGLEDRPRMLLGTDLLADRVLSISYGRGQIFVE
jgi:hypothetical protein